MNLEFQFLNSVYQLINQSLLFDTEKQKIKSLLDRTFLQLEAINWIIYGMTEMNNTPEGEKTGRILMGQIYDFIKELDLIHVEITKQENNLPGMLAIKRQLRDLIKAAIYTGIIILKIVGFFFKKQKRMETVSEIEEMGSHLPLSKWGCNETPFLPFEPEQEKQLNQYFDNLYSLPTKLAELLKKERKRKV